MKNSFDELHIEITRKCNLNCKHCGRGNPQNMTITHDVISRILDNVLFCNNLCLTGGEPFLEPNTLDCLFDEIIKRKIKLKYVGCVTKGSVLNESIVNSVNKIADYCRIYNKDTETYTACISISNDVYHQNTDYNNALQWYKSKVNKNVDVCFNQEKDNITVLSYSGKTIKNYDTFNNALCLYSSGRHMIEQKKNHIFTPIQVCANGNVIISHMQSYNDSDKNNIGNILNDDIYIMCDKYNKQQCFFPNECYMQDVLKGILLNLYSPCKDRLLAVLGKSGVQETYNLMETDRRKRQMLRRKYPQMNIDSIRELSIAIVNYSSNGEYISRLNFLEGVTGFNTGVIDYPYNRKQELQIIKFLHEQEKGTQNES